MSRTSQTYKLWSLYTQVSLRLRWSYASATASGYLALFGCVAMWLKLKENSLIHMLEITCRSAMSHSTQRTNIYCSWFQTFAMFCKFSLLRHRGITQKTYKSILHFENQLQHVLDCCHSHVLPNEWRGKRSIMSTCTMTCYRGLREIWYNILNCNWVATRWQ
jgi:hypothetical protein